MPALNKNIKIGDVFDKLTVIQYCKGNKKGCWECQCVCGNIIYKNSDKLFKKCGHSCRDCCNKKFKEQNIKHGKSTSIEYHSYYTMVRRCCNPDDKDYSRYGGRGIKVCEKWLGENGFENFLKDMKERPSIDHTIHRVNNDGNYEPDNCIWTIQEVQDNNKTNTHFITYNNKTQSLALWAKEKGMKRVTLSQRINKYKWSIEKSLNTPIRIRNVE